MDKETEPQRGKTPCIYKIIPETWLYYLWSANFEDDIVHMK